MSQQTLRFAIESAVREAEARHHEYVTVEHLLFALLFEPIARDVLASCGADMTELQVDLEEYFEAHVPKIADDTSEDPKQTLGFHRVLEKAILHVQSCGKASIDGSDVLIQMQDETESHAAFLVQKQGISKMDMLEYISHGVKKDTDEGEDGEGASPEHETDDEEESGRAGSSKSR